MELVLTANYVFINGLTDTERTELLLEAAGKKGSPEDRIDLSIKKAYRYWKK